MGWVRARVVLASMTALLAVACSDREAQVANRETVSAALPDGLWFSVNFPAEGTEGLRHTEAVDQPWLMPCPDLELRADRERTAAYGLSSSHGGDEKHLVDSRQLVVYDDVATAASAIDELATELKTCAPGGSTISDLRVLAGPGERSLVADAVVTVAAPVPWRRNMSKAGQQLFLTQHGRSVMTTTVAHEVRAGPNPWMDKGHLLLAEQLCAFDAEPCTLRDDVQGAPERTLPQLSDLLPGAGKAVALSGSEAAGPTACSEASIATLGAVSALRHTYGDSGDAPAASIVLAEFMDQESARRAQIHLNAALVDCRFALPLTGWIDQYTDFPCWVETVDVPRGEAQTCHAEYSTREAPPWPLADALPPGLTGLDTGVLRVGPFLVVADLAQPATEDDVGPGRLPDVLGRIVEQLDVPGTHEPTYDGRDHVLPPVRLGISAVHLTALRDPLSRPATFRGCTDIRLRSGSIATVDGRSRRVVAYHLGGADTTPRGVSATATLEDALAAYPEGKREDLEAHRSSMHSVEAQLSDGTSVRVMHDTDYERYTRVWLTGARCGDGVPLSLDF